MLHFCYCRAVEGFPENMQEKRMSPVRAPEATAESGAHRKVTATDRVLEYILDELDATRLGPGSRVNAARIAQHLNLSAAPVREALCVLAGRGVVDLLPDRGAVIATITSREVKLLWEVIASVTCVGLRLAAKAIQEGAGRSELVSAYDNLRARASESPPLQFILALNEWHYAANRLGGNEFVTLTLDRLGVAYWDRYLVGLIDVQANIQQYLENYRRMHEAVLAGDGPAAAAIFQFHADWSVSLIRQREAAAPQRRRRKRTRLPAA